MPMAGVGHAQTTAVSGMDFTRVNYFAPISIVADGRLPTMTISTVTRRASRGAYDKPPISPREIRPLQIIPEINNTAGHKTSQKQAGAATRMAILQRRIISPRFHDGQHKIQRFSRHGRARPASLAGRSRHDAQASFAESAKISRSGVSNFTVEAACRYRQYHFERALRAAITAFRARHNTTPPRHADGKDISHYAPRRATTA